MARRKAKRPTADKAVRGPSGFSAGELRDREANGTPARTQRPAIDYDRIKVMSAELGRPAHTLIALAPDNDPFYITPARRAAAEWFAELWERLGAGAGMHVRRFHYLIVSQETPIEMIDARHAMARGR